MAKIRHYQSCYAHHDRDINAAKKYAKNIGAEGLKQMSGCDTQSDNFEKQAEASSLGEAVNPEKPKRQA